MVSIYLSHGVCVLRCQSVFERYAVVIVSSYRDEIAFRIFSSQEILYVVNNKWTNDVITFNGQRKKNHYRYYQASGIKIG